MFVQALVVGMTYDQFWYDDPRLFFLYIEAYELKQKNEVRSEEHKINTLAWLQGVYVVKALGCTFGKSEYPSKPIDLSDSDRTDTDVQTMKDNEMLAIAAGFENFVNAYNITNQQEEGE